MDIPSILKRVQKAGYAIFTRGSYNVNIIGIRSPNRKAGSFDDQIHLVFKDEFGNWVDMAFQCTTDAGLYWLEGKNGGNSRGCAILKAGQYRSVYRIDRHRGKYEALCQRKGAVTVYRDNNRDNVLDMDESKTQTGYFGINIHRASALNETVSVDRYSAGCQVLNNPMEFAIFMAICKKAADRWGNSFTYTLLED